MIWIEIDEYDDGFVTLNWCELFNNLNSLNLIDGIHLFLSLFFGMLITIKWKIWRWIWLIFISIDD